MNDEYTPLGDAVNETWRSHPIWLRKVEYYSDDERLYDDKDDFRRLVLEKGSSITPWDFLAVYRKRRSDLGLPEKLTDYSVARQLKKIHLHLDWIEMTGDLEFWKFYGAHGCGHGDVWFGAETHARLGSDGRYHPWSPEKQTCAGAGEPDGTHFFLCSWRVDPGGKYRLPNAIGRQPESIDGWWSARLPVSYEDDLVPIAEVPRLWRCSETNKNYWPPCPSETKIGKLKKRIVEEFGPMCMLCRRHYGIYLDHEHFSGLVRGLLCHLCNAGVEGCQHVSGCADSEYLNKPPLSHLGILYPNHRVVTREAWYPRLLTSSPRLKPGDSRA